MNDAPEADPHAVPSTGRLAAKPMGAWRGTVAFLCGVLSVACLVLGVPLLYTTRVLLDGDMFASRVAASLSEPGVAREVARQVTDQVLAAQPDMVAFRPVILGATESLVHTGAFRAVVRRAARSAHGALLSSKGRDIALSMDDLAVVLRGALPPVPELQQKLPKKLSALVRPLQQLPAGARTFLSFLDFVRKLRLSGRILLVLGLVFGIARVVLSHRHVQAVARLGLGIAVAAFLLALVVRFGGDVLALFVRDPGERQFVAGLWHGFLFPLARWLLVLSGVGVVLLAGASSLLDRMDVEELTRRFTDWVRVEPRHRGFAILRGVLLPLLGALAVLHPQAAAGFLTMTAGAVLFFFGLRELFRLLVHALPDRMHEVAAGTALSGGPARPARHGGLVYGVVGVLVVGLVVTGVLLLNREEQQAVAAPEAEIQTANGHAELADRTLPQVTLPASHNSMSSADIDGWYMPQQERGIVPQLEDGIRGLLIDIHYGQPVGDKVKTLIEDAAKDREKYVEAVGEEGFEAAMRIRDRMVGQPTGGKDVYVAHGFCELGAVRFIGILEGIRDFLVANPDAVLMICLQDEGVTPADVAHCFEESGLVRFVYRGPVDGQWPTLRTMIATDQRVLVLAENDAAGVPWYHQAWDVMQETPYTFHTPEEMSNKPNRGGTKAPLLLMNNWIESTPTPKPSNAAIVNAYDFLLKRARACAKERRHPVNVIAVDFYRTGDLFRVVDTLNGVAPPEVAARN